MNAILRIRDTGRRGNRDLYVTTLEKALGHPLSLNRFDQPKHDVWTIVDACLQHLGAVHALVEVLARFQGGSRQILELRELVTELLPDPQLTTAERRHLCELVRLLDRRGLTPDSLPALYQRAVGPDGPPLEPDRQELHDVVAQLEEAPDGDDGLPPLLAFAADLAQRVEGDPGAALWDWTRRFAVRLEVDPSLLDRLRLESARAPRAGAGAGPRTYLVVECQPDAAAAGQFLFTAWLQTDSRPGETLLRGEEPRPLAALPELLCHLLFEHPTVTSRAADPELTIEFVVPRELLDYPFDQIKIDIAGLKVRLGVEHPVVLRSLDRLRARGMYHKWWFKWNQLRQNPACAEICWVAERGLAEHEQFYTRLLDPPVGVLAAPFPCGPEPVPADEQWIGIQAGIPIMAWSRADDDPAGFREEAGVLLSAALLKDDLPALPHRVHALRRAAVLNGLSGDRGADGHADEPERAGAGHLGLRLSLLYDDAERLPEPYQRLKAPA